MTFVFCKTTGKNEQSFYVGDERKQYYLFTQKFRKNNKEFFEHGVLLDDIYDFSRTHNTYTIRTLEKIQRFIPYVEREEGIMLRRQTERKQVRSDKSFRKRKQELCCLTTDY